MIKSGSNVRLHYTLTVDGEVLDSSTDGDPLTYVHGDGQIIPGLEAAIEGLGAGDKKTVEVSAAKGYGERQPDAVQEIPRTAFRDPERLKVGDGFSGMAGDQQIRFGKSQRQARTRLLFKIDYKGLGPHSNMACCINSTAGINKHIRNARNINVWNRAISKQCP